MANGHAFVADYLNGMRVVNVRNPANCVQLAGYWTFRLARSVAVSGNYAWLGEELGGLTVLDVSDPTNCVFVTRHAANKQVVGATGAGGFIYTANGSGGLSVLPSLRDVEFTVRVNADVGVPFTVEAATDLSALMPWAPVFTTNVATMPFDYVDFDVKVADKPRKYYRVRQP